MALLRVLMVAATAFLGLTQAADTDTITWGGDNSRTGYQTKHNMDPVVVGSSQFGQLFQAKLPGVYVKEPEQIFSQPLVYTPRSGTKQYVYIATTQNNVYKLDAKTGTIIASRNLHIPFLTADLEGCVDINPTIGITATGVIDPETDTLYLTAKTYVNQAGGQTAQGRSAGRYYVHALDVNDLSERPNFPVSLEGLIANNAPDRMFQGGIHHQRPALLHTGNFIYAGFASHCVQYNFTGWIIGWDKTTGQIVEKFATEGKGVPNDVRGAGVWMSGGGIASDDKGSIFLATGNGYASQLADAPVKGFNPPTALEEAALHMTINDDGSLRLVDFFMPWEKRALDGADKDLGTSPLEILPSQFSCGSVTRIGVVTGKSGKTYFLNLDNLGGYKNGKDGFDDVIYVYEHLNSVYAGAGVYPLEGGYIYINVIQHPTIVFKFSCSAGQPTFTKVAQTTESNAYILGVSHGTTTSLNDQPGTGLLWITDVQGYGLRVYDAIPQDSGTLRLIQSFNIPSVTKFTRPVFGDGIVYVGTTQGAVFAFGSPVNLPLNCTSPVEFGTVNINDSSASQTVTCKALIPLTLTGFALNDAKSKDFSISGFPDTPLDMVADASFTVQAQFSPSHVGLTTNDILVNTTNKVGGYSSNTHVRLSGTGQSVDPLFQLSPQVLTFNKAVTGQDAAGVSETILARNLGINPLTVDTVEYSLDSTDGPFEEWDRSTDDLVVSRFTIKNVPTSIEPKNDTSITVVYDSSESGTYQCYIRMTTNGGTQTVSIIASSGPPPVAKFEFQTPDGSGWVDYVPGTPFSFGNVTENTSRSLKFRVTNAAPDGGASLSLTVSKPPFGVAGLVRALNQVDLAEGTSLAPGQSANATLICNVPYAQWNTDPYNGTAQWTINTNDPNPGKQVIKFFCNAVAEQAPPLLPNGQGQFKYAGCWKDNTPDRQLPSQLITADNLTNAACISACAAGGYIFCGTEYHRECWAGNVVPLTKVDDAKCNFNCAGDLNQICGGNGNNNEGTYISLFADTLKWNGNTTRPPPPPPPVVNPGVSGYASIGCYTEVANARALTDGRGTTKKTVKSCVDACHDNGKYVYAGLEYGGECWCGNALASGSASAPIAECSMACKDNVTETCGGPARLNVYQLESTISKPGSAPSPATGNSTLSDQSSGNNTATNNTFIASTFSPSSSLSSSLSPSKTEAFGVIEGSAAPGVSQTSSASSTSTPTGPYIRSQLGNWSFQGCWTEATNSRALVGRTYANDSMTLDSCATFCDGTTYFGVEYGRECYCGDVLQAGSVSASNQADCSFPCGGDKTQFCGAGVRLELYKYSPSASNSSATAGPVPGRNGTFTMATTSAGSTSTAAALSTRADALTSFTNSSLVASTATVTSNATAASPSSTSGSLFVTDSAAPAAASLEAVTNDPASPSPSTVNTPSNSSSSSISGVSTTSTSSSPSSTPTGPVISNGNANFTYYACVAEPIGGRALDAQVLNAANMTVDMCLRTCWMYKYAGIEYGRECWCGNSLNLLGNSTQATRNVSDADCNFACPGNGTEYCGAGVRLSMYTLRRVTKRFAWSLR